MTTEKIPKEIPTRIFACLECEYRTPHRWALARHLRLAHKYTKRNAKLVASECEFRLIPNPPYYRVSTFLEEEDEIEDEE